MPNYTKNLHLVKPLQSEQYNIDVFNSNADKIDQFAGQVPARALTADKLTTGAKINGVNFKGDTDIVTGAGFYYDTVTYGAGNLAFIYNQGGALELHKSLSAGNIGHNPLTTTGYWEKVELGGGSGLEVCDIGMALYVDETKGLRRYLNGQIVDINTNTQAFLNRLQEITTLHPSLLCTEEEWQTAKTMSAFGQVGKFVFNYSGDDIVSVRLPRVVNVQGLFDLQNLGMTVSAGLPNITGGLGYIGGSQWGIPTPTGAFNGTNGGNMGFANGESGRWADGVTFNASRSSSIYGKSNTVQPEAIQYPYFIQIATGSETENNIINEIELNNPFSLFDSKYSDHELNNLSWLKSEGQWNNKAVYPSAYDELLREYNNPDRLATFNKDAFTVVGNPTITADGIASGFSNSNYLQINSNISTYNSLVVLSPIFQYRNNYDNIQEEYLTGSNIRFSTWRTRPSCKVNIGGTFREINGSIGALVFNHRYQYKLEAINNTITFYFKDIDFDTDWQIGNSITGIIDNFNSIFIGINNVNSDYYWLQSKLDLKQFSITVDGVKVFSGAKSKVKLSTEEYTDYDFVLNTAEETFRLPLKNGEENLAGDEYIQISTLPANDTTLTAPANGYYTISAWASQTTSRFYMTNLSNNLTVGEAGANLSSVSWDYVMPCKKGDKIQFHYESIVIQDGIFYFCPNIGNGSLYYYVGETVQNANLIDAGRIEEQLANKVDSTNTQWAVSACMPDYSAGKNVSSATIHTATVDGYVFAQAQSTSGGNGGHVDIYNKNGTLIKSWNYVGAEYTQTASYSAFMCPIPKGYSYNVHGGVDIVIQFYPAKGTEV